MSYKSTKLESTKDIDLPAGQAGESQPVCSAGRLSHEEMLAKYGITQEQFDEVDDELLLALVLERKKNDTGVRISWEEHLANHGMTQEELDAMEDIDLEYELSD